VRNRRQLNSLQNTWPYGYSMPIAVRYTQDAFSRSGWLWPVDAKGEPLKATSYMAVGFYVAKYVNKKSDMDLAAKGLGAKEIGRASCRERVERKWEGGNCKRKSAEGKGRRGGE